VHSDQAAAARQALPPLFVESWMRRLDDETSPRIVAKTAAV
jgi:hypothetical protein